MTKKSVCTTENQISLVDATIADDQALRTLIAVPISTKGVQMSFQREPSFFKASDLIYREKLHVLLEDVDQKIKVACYSNGHRPCYINRAIAQLRYASDLRIDQGYRGKALLKILAKHVRQTMQAPNYSQMIIFNDNFSARAALQTAKTGMPDYYDEGLIETLTLTDLGSSKKINYFLSNSTQNQADLKDLKVCTAQPQHLALMNQFIADMAQYYNFIPAYNFEELCGSHPYFSGLSLSDFRLYFKGETLLGLFGLWDQHEIKQTKILNYNFLISICRPLYNLFTPLSKMLRLPKRGQAFKYHVLHSLLCHPRHLALHHQMLGDAFGLSKKRGVGVISFTLSHQDPRYQMNQFYKGQRLTGMHGFISYEGDPRPNFDPNLIPYLEVGRI